MYGTHGRRAMEIAVGSGESSVWRMVWALASGIAILLGLAGAAAADEAVLRDGRRVPGTILGDAQGRLIFTPSGKNDPLPLKQIEYIRFEARPGKPLLSATAHQVTLPDGQSLTGELLG